MAKVSEFFVNKEQQVSGHTKGLIEDLPANQLPFNAIADGWNLDFYAGYDMQRQPIIMNTDISSIIPDGYELDNFHFKEFTDKSGNKIECCIAGFKKAGDRYRIYINKWYNPGSEYCNECDGTEGWQDRWIEITEYERLQVINYVTEYRYNNNIHNFAEMWGIPVSTNKQANYYKGWYVYDTDTELYQNFEDRIVGIVVKSDSNNIYVRRSTKGTTSSQDWGQFDGIVRTTQLIGKYYTLVRYPWIAENKYENTFSPQLNYDNFKQVTEIGFCDINNSVVISMGHGMRPMWIGFIPDRKYFGSAVNWDTSGFPANTMWKRNFDGLWAGCDIANVPNAETILNDVQPEYSNDMLQETAEMGLGINVIGNTNTDVKNLYAIAIQYDEFQTVRVKYIYAQLKNISIRFHPDTDKRITGIMLFHTKTADEFNNPYLLPIAKGGITDITAVTIAQDNQTKNAYRLDIEGIGNEEIIYGISINNYFNCTFEQQRINLKTKILTRLENNLIAANISPESFLFSSEKKNYNLPKCIALSQVQNIELSAYNVFGESRFLQPVNDEITAIAAFNQVNLAIWTAKDMAIYTLTNPMEFKISNVLELANRGTYGMQNVCVAQTDTYFGGLYWVNKDGIYCFKNNNVTEITEGFWKRNTFDKLPESDKANIKLVYKPSTNEIFCFINSNLVYIFEINNNRWKKYKYPESITGKYLKTSDNGEIFISGYDAIFKTEPKTSMLWKDLQTANDILTSGTAIEMRMIKRWNYGTDIENLIVHKIKIETSTGAIPNTMGYEWGSEYQPHSGCSYQKENHLVTLNPNGLWTNGYYKKVNNYWFGQTVRIMDLSDPNNIINYYKSISEITGDYKFIIDDSAGEMPEINENNIRVIVYFTITLPQVQTTLYTNTFTRIIKIDNRGTSRNEIIIPPTKRKRESTIQITINIQDPTAKQLAINEIIETSKKSKDRKLIK